MKIVVYFNSMAPAGGIERVISKHIKFLAKDNEVILLTNDLNKSFYEIPENVSHESLNIDVKLDMNSRLKRMFKLGTSFLFVIKGLKKIIKKHNPDIVYVASPLGLFQAFIAMNGGKKILVTEHSSFSAYNKVYKFIVRNFYNRVGLLTVPTTDDSKFYKSIGIKNAYLPNPLSFYPDLPSSLNNKIVLNVGRFTDDKRHDLLIELWAKTTGKDNGWKLHIVGKGENEVKIKSLIKKNKVEDSVILLPTTKDIEQVFLNSSVFVLTSRAEGFGLVLAEAMASGVPCVSFNCPSGPKDIIDNGKNGFLIEEGNHDEYVAKLDELMDDEKTRKKMGLNSRIDIQKFDENNISEKINKLISNSFGKR